MKVLVTGGAGYKGTILVGELLEKGHKVTVLDNFMYGYEPVLPFVKYKNCDFVKKDIRNISEKDVKNFDVIYHLAGISGYSACEANPHSAQIINVDSTKNLTALLSKSQVLVYASTTSFYGKSGQTRYETDKPEPVSLYGVTKYKAEVICMERENSIAFRFATLFGVSAKMRCDLMLNDFVYRAMIDRSLVLFDSKSMRTFLHVRDAIKAYLMVFDDLNAYVGNVFNVGCNSMNYSKLQLANIIKKHLNFNIIDSELLDPDERNFIINFDKISKLGFKSTITAEEGIEELIKLYSFYHPYASFRPI